MFGTPTYLLKIDPYLRYFLLNLTIDFEIEYLLLILPEFQELLIYFAKNLFCPHGSTRFNYFEIKKLQLNIYMLKYIYHNGCKFEIDCS